MIEIIIVLRYNMELKNNMQRKKENEYFTDCYFYFIINCLFLLLPMLSASVCYAKNESN